MTPRSPASLLNASKSAYPSHSKRNGNEKSRAPQLHRMQCFERPYGRLASRPYKVLEASPFSILNSKLSSMVFRFFLLSIVGYVAFAAGCGQRVVQAPDGASRHAHAPFAEGDHIDLVLINQSAEPIFAVVLQTEDGAYTTENLLQDGALAIGQSVTLHEVPPGIWHIIVQDVDGRSKVYASQPLHQERAYSLIIDAYNWGASAHPESS